MNNKIKSKKKSNLKFKIKIRDSDLKKAENESIDLIKKIIDNTADEKDIKHYESLVRIRSNNFDSKKTSLKNELVYYPQYSDTEFNKKYMKN